MSGAVFLVLEKENRFVRFHALQSVLAFGAITLLWVLLNAVPILGFVLGVLIIIPGSAVIWLVLMFKAYQGEDFKLPIVGPIAAETLSEKTSADIREQETGELMAVSEASVLDALRAVRDPDLHSDIVALEFVKDLRIDGGRVVVHDRADDAGVSGEGSDARSGARRGRQACRA